MKLFGALVFTTVLGSTLAGDCMSDYNSKCLKIAEMPEGFDVYYTGGNPCFSNGGARWCFTDTGGNMQPCTCKAECGCQAAGPPPPPPPKCDNAKVPSAFPKKCDAKDWGEDNSMCIYTSMGSGCGKVCNRDLTDDEKKILLDKHNELRRRVAVGNETINNQPKASNMEELVWDDALAVSAQRWTDQCIGGHDKNRRTPDYNPVGQNYAETSSSMNSGKTDFTKFVQMWYDEVKDFHSPPTSYIDQQAPNTGVVGHYTQVVWAKTKKVGCGFVHIDTQDGWFKKIINCNYYPAANLMGAPVYKIGEPGSECKTNNNGLCA